MRPVTLHDGTVVDSSSDEWRHECEARHIVDMPSLSARREYLAHVERKRGIEAANKLKNTVRLLWQAKQNAAA
jgi:hypothetical protein